MNVAVREFKVAAVYLIMTARAERMDLEVRINFMICCADVFFSRWCSECGQWFDPEDLVSEWCWEPSSEYSSWSNLLKSAIFSAWKSVSEFRTDLPTHSVGTWSANENDILRSPRINHCAFISPLLAEVSQIFRKRVYYFLFPWKHSNTRTWCANENDILRSPQTSSLRVRFSNSGAEVRELLNVFIILCVAPQVFEIKLMVCDRKRHLRPPRNLITARSFLHFLR